MGKCLFCCGGIIMPKYRKKPVVIKAILFTGTEENCKKLENFCNGYISFNYTECKSIRDSSTAQTLVSAEIETLEGIMEASVGDYIIKGVNGEFYPCKPDIFEKTYEKVDG